MASRRSKTARRQKLEVSRAALEHTCIPHISGMPCVSIHIQPEKNSPALESSNIGKSQSAVVKGREEDMTRGNQLAIISQG